MDLLPATQSPAEITSLAFYDRMLLSNLHRGAIDLGMLQGNVELRYYWLSFARNQCLIEVRTAQRGSSATALKSDTPLSTMSLLAYSQVGDRTNIGCDYYISPL